MRRILAALLFILIASQLTAWADDATPKWIWLDEVVDQQEAWFRFEFNLDGEVKSALLAGAADNRFVGFVNGEKLLRNDDWRTVGIAQVTDSLRRGRNVVAVRGKNTGGDAGMFCRLSIELENGEKVVITSDEHWKTNTKPIRSWTHVGFDDSAWSAARVRGSVGGMSRGRVASLWRFWNRPSRPIPILLRLQARSRT